MRKLLLFLCFSGFLFAQSPNAYKRLGASFEGDLDVMAQLKHHPYFFPYKENFSKYCVDVEASFSVGYRLDKAVMLDSTDKEVLSKAYLKTLRDLEKAQREIEGLYVQALNYAMKNDDMQLFELLLNHTMKPIENRHIRKRLQKYYKKRRTLKTIRVAEVLLDDLALEEKSRRISVEETQAYEEHLQVVAEEEAARLRKMTAQKRTRNVIVSTQKSDAGYRFFAENLNQYTVTVTLNFNEIINFTPSQSLPQYVELLGNSRREMLEMIQSDRKKRASFSSSFGWVMGSASAQHDDTVLYRLPFAKGSRAVVSQGYDGASTHTGLSRYAVDFAVPVGTPVYAARLGKVVAAVSRHHKGGYAKRFGKFANYIVIEHADKTLGKYYHLKKDGVVVAVGDVVRTGQLIGHSGNTGYSSGPHLHFSVSKVDPNSMNRPMTIPVRFRSDTGTVSRPKRGESYGVGSAK